MSGTAHLLIHQTPILKPFPCLIQSDKGRSRQLLGRNTTKNPQQYPERTSPNPPNPPASLGSSQHGMINTRLPGAGSSECGVLSRIKLRCPCIHPQIIRIVHRDEAIDLTLLLHTGMPTPRGQSPRHVTRHTFFSITVSRRPSLQTVR